MEYVKTGRSESDYTDIINDLVQKARENPTWKREYMDAMMDAVRQQREMREAEEKGMKHGERKKAVEDARRMLDEGLSPEQTARITQLSLEDVQKVQKNKSQ